MILKIYDHLDCNSNRKHRHDLSQLVFSILSSVIFSILSSVILSILSSDEDTRKSQDAQSETNHS